MLASPENTKFMLPMLDELLLVEELALAEEDERSNIQGTTTCLPLALLVVALEGVVVVELVLVLEVELVSVLAPELFRESTAKSMRPDVGLIRTSWIVPNCWPEDVEICAP